MLTKKVHYYINQYCLITFSLKSLMTRIKKLINFIPCLWGIQLGLNLTVPIL
jgi:hypothetical protein